MTPTNELMTAGQYLSPEAERFAMEQRMARLFVASGLFGDIKGQTSEQTVAQAYVKIALGSSMGFAPAEAMSGIDIIQGRPCVGSQLRAARMQRNGYSWSIDQLDTKGCVLTVYANGQRLGEAAYMEEDAQRAGLLGKDNWKKDPTSMYFARAITRAQRRYAPGVLSLDVMSTEEVVEEQLPAAVATQAKSDSLAAKMTEQAKRQPPPSQVPAAQTQPVNATPTQASGGQSTPREGDLF